MAISPQFENGFTRISNDLLEALCSYRLPGEEMQCLLVVIRKTCGYQREDDAISLSQFAAMTGLKRPNVVRALNGLVSKKILTVIKNDTVLVNKYAINKGFSGWKPFVKKKGCGIENDNEVLSETIHTKERKERKPLKDSSRQLSLLSDAAEADGGAPPESATSQASPRALVDAWNQETAGSGLSSVRDLSASRRQKCTLRLMERGLDEWREVFRLCVSTPFLRGERGKWKARFDWLIENDGNALKVLEGQYADVSKGQPTGRAADRYAMLRGL